MLSRDELQKFDEEYKGRIAHVKGFDDAWEIVLRRPESKEYKRFRSMVNGDRASDAQETLVRQLAIYPQGDALDELLNEYPGIPEACGKSIRVLAGIEASEQGKG